jgi:hypothetical protein
MSTTNCFGKKAATLKHALMTSLRIRSQSEVAWLDHSLRRAMQFSAVVRASRMVIWQRNRIRDLIATAGWRVAGNGNDVVRLVRYLELVERDSPR